MQIEVNVKNKIAIAAQDYIVVCGNSDYIVVFTFDDEWNGHEVKTARFGFTQDGVKKFIDVVFTDNACAMPVLSNVNTVEIGVYAGDLRTTTPCLLSCKKSILCEGGAPAEPEEKIYNQIVGLCNEAVETANSVEKRANNGEFNGKDGADGNDYVLTETDKQEIAKMVDVGGGNVATDWLQNDKTQPDYVKNRTHYSLGKKYEDITWDGDLSAPNVLDFSDDFKMVKVSDMTPSVGEFIGATISLSDGRVLTCITSNELKIPTGYLAIAIEDSFYSVNSDSYDLLYVLNSPDEATEILGLPSDMDAGIYLTWYKDKEYITKISLTESVVKLDPKYIPPLPFLQIGNTTITEEQLKKLL